MREVLVKFAEPVLSHGQTSYRAQACAGAMSDGLWEGWIEFIPIAPGEGIPLRSPARQLSPTEWIRCTGPRA